MRKLPPVCLDSSFANRTVSCWFPQHSGQSTVSNSTGPDSSGTVGALNNRKGDAVFTRELSRWQCQCKSRGNGERVGKLIQVRFRVNWDRGFVRSRKRWNFDRADVATRKNCGPRHDRLVRELALPHYGEFFRLRPATTPSGVAVTHPTVGESAAISDDRCCRAAGSAELPPRRCARHRSPFDSSAYNPVFSRDPRALRAHCATLDRFRAPRPNPADGDCRHLRPAARRNELYRGRPALPPPPLRGE